MVLTMQGTVNVYVCALRNSAHRAVCRTAPTQSPVSLPHPPRPGRYPAMRVGTAGGAHLGAEDGDNALLPLGLQAAFAQAPLDAALHRRVHVQRRRQAACTLQHCLLVMISST